MENATKALLIAGGVLIAIIILAIGVGLYKIYSNQAKEYNQIISNTEIQKFNSKFIIYVGRENITPQEIVTVVNLAKEYNNEVTINIKDGYNEKIEISSPEDFIRDYLDKQFICEAKNCKYDETGKIKEITFEKN